MTPAYLRRAEFHQEPAWRLAGLRFAARHERGLFWSFLAFCLIVVPVAFWRVGDAFLIEHAELMIGLALGGSASTMLVFLVGRGK